MPDKTAMLVMVITAISWLPSTAASDVAAELLAGSVQAESSAVWSSPSLSFLLLGEEAPAVELDMVNVTVRKLTAQRTVIFYQDEFEYNRSYPSASLTVVTGEGPQHSAARVNGRADVIMNSALIRGVESASLFNWSLETDCRMLVTFNVPCLDIFGAFEALAGNSTTSVNGEIELFLRGPTLYVLSTNGMETHTSSGAEGEPIGPLPRAEKSMLWITGQVVQGTVEAKDLKLYSHDPVLTTGLANFEDARGTFRSRGDSVIASGEDVVVEGSLSMQFGGVIPRDSTGHVGEARYARTLRANLAGEVNAIRLNGEAIEFRSADRSAGLISVLVAIAIALGAYLDLVAYSLVRGLLPLFSRLSQDEVLVSAVRSKIFHAASQRPGLSVRAVQRELGLGWGATIYHVRLLEKYGYLATEVRGRSIHVFGRAFPSEHRGAAILLASFGHRSVAQLAMSRREVSIVEIAAELHVARTTARRRVRALVGEGLLAYKTSDSVEATRALRAITDEPLVTTAT